MDGSAYLTAEQWQTLINEWEIDVARMRDKRYDMVIHLVTAADGAPKYFDTKNNAARIEDLDTAIALDRKIQSGWLSHPYYIVIDNQADKGIYIS